MGVASLIVKTPARLNEAALTWGSTAEERARRYPCDELIPDPHVTCWRAIDVDAAPDVLYRWLCQLRAAPYSYDWLDNLGRRSPTTLTPGLDALEVGQRFMTIFDLVSYEPGAAVTLRTRASKPLLGDVALTYSVAGRPGGSRLVCKVLVVAPAGPIGWAWRRVAALGDLVMMRKQFLTLKRLAERGGRPDVASRSWQTPRTSLLPRPR